MDLSIALSLSQCTHTGRQEQHELVVHGEKSCTRSLRNCYSSFIMHVLMVTQYVKKDTTEYTTGIHLRNNDYYYYYYYCSSRELLQLTFMYPQDFSLCHTNNYRIMTCLVSHSKNGSWHIQHIATRPACLWQWCVPLNNLLWPFFSCRKSLQIL